jgi:hypothetical protein
VIKDVDFYKPMFSPRLTAEWAYIDICVIHRDESALGRTVCLKAEIQPIRRFVPRSS